MDATWVRLTQPEISQWPTQQCVNVRKLQPLWHKVVHILLITVKKCFPANMCNNACLAVSERRLCPIWSGCQILGNKNQKRKKLHADTTNIDFCPLLDPRCLFYGVSPRKNPGKKICTNPNSCKWPGWIGIDRQNTRRVNATPQQISFRLRKTRKPGSIAESSLSSFWSVRKVWVKLWKQNKAGNNTCCSGLWTCSNLRDSSRNPGQD